MFKRKKNTIFIIFLIAGVLIVQSYLRRDIVKYFYSVTPRSVYVGDAISIDLKIICKKNLIVKQPDMLSAISDYGSIKENSSKIDLFFHKVLETKYVITIYDPGEYIIPETKFEYSNDGGNEWFSFILPEKKITVKSLLPEDFNSNPAKIKIGGSLDAGGGSPFEGKVSSGGSYNIMTGPIRFKILEKEKIRYPSKTKESVVKALFFLFTAIILTTIIFLAYKIKNKIFKEKVSSLDRALLSLRDLEKQHLEKNLNAKEYCSKLHQIVQTFFREYFVIKDKEMVFEEFREEIVNIDSIGYEEKKYFLDLLSSCEDIKYSPDENILIPDSLQAGRVITFVNKITSTANNNDKEKVV